MQRCEGCTSCFSGTLGAALATYMGEGALPVVTCAVGDKAPELAADLVLASGIVEAPGDAAVLVVSPADQTAYYYMEGMNTPMGNFRNDGRQPPAAVVVDRALWEAAQMARGETR